ncbi:cobalt ECF transporter T component CbiQ [Mumia quercus]|uniref:cobalt ECF transporter T component CbiQ n=1 Tax=Mumia quercus TaxID=2976125 RepID=UPI0021D24DB1|nr:cobalt ECF transporter T component CbiQ [Mumia quercus]
MEQRPHGHKLYFAADSPVHRAPAHLKLLALLGFMLVVVATPGTAYPVFAVYAVILLGVVVVSRVPFGYLLPRMLVEIPFVVFALLLPFLATGPQTTFLGMTVSQHGLEAAGSLLIKATIGVAASLTLAATTEPHALIDGLRRLRLPYEMVQIMAFMIRYLDVVTDEMHRMRVARESRGFRATSFRQWGALARTGSALFIRSYERGERVHLAMLSRGHDPRGGRS